MIYKGWRSFISFNNQNQPQRNAYSSWVWLPHWSYLSIVVGSCSTDNFKTSVNPDGSLKIKGDGFGNDRNGPPRFDEK